mmetsp:Transcript_84437/g.272989  ORF Transcript_84437/g.272989 Transcript_84437/m.272989 type:complete len:245 (+) Transcript_84437:1404-2138(+)
MITTQRHEHTPMHEQNTNARRPSMPAWLAQSNALSCPSGQVASKAQPAWPVQSLLAAGFATSSQCTSSPVRHSTARCINPAPQATLHAPHSPTDHSDKAVMKSRKTAGGAPDSINARPSGTGAPSSFSISTMEPSRHVEPLPQSPSICASISSPFCTAGRFSPSSIAVSCISTWPGSRANRRRASPKLSSCRAAQPSRRFEGLRPSVLAMARKIVDFILKAHPKLTAKSPLRCRPRPVPSQKVI